MLRSSCSQFGTVFGRITVELNAIPRAGILIAQGWIAMGARSLGNAIAVVARNAPSRAACYNRLDLHRKSFWSSLMSFRILTALNVVLVLSSLALGQESACRAAAV